MGRAASWYLYRLSHTISVACSSTVKLGDATYCWPSSRSCPAFTSSLTDSRRQCGDPSKENGRMFAPGSPGAVDVARRQLGLNCWRRCFARPLPRTDRRGRHARHHASTPDTRLFCVGEDPSPRLLLQKFPRSGNGPNNAPPMGPYSRVAAQHWARHREDFPAAESPSQQAMMQELAGTGRRRQEMGGNSDSPVRSLLGSIRACTVSWVLHLPRCAPTSLTARSAQNAGCQWAVGGSGWWRLVPEALRP